MNVTNLSFPGPQNQELKFTRSLFDLNLGSYNVLHQTFFSNNDPRFHQIECQRLEYLKNYIQEISDKLSIKAPKKIKISCLNPAPGFSVSLSSSESCIHPSLLVYKTEMPENLQAPTNSSSLEVSIFEDWLHRKFNISKNESQTNPIGDRVTRITMQNTASIAKFHALLQQHPDKHVRLLKFIIAQELIRSVEDQKITYLQTLALILRKGFLNCSLLEAFGFSMMGPVVPLIFSSFFKHPSDIIDIKSILSNSLLLEIGALVSTILITKMHFSDFIKYERTITHQAVDLTQDSEAARIFYRSLEDYQDRGRTYSNIIAHPFRGFIKDFPLKNRLGHLDQIAKKLHLSK